MRYFVLTLILLAGLLFALAACTDSSSSPPNDESETSDGINVSLTTVPHPPVNGSIELVASVMDAQGQPVEDAGVFFMASHTDMAGMYTDGQGIAQGRVLCTFAQKCAIGTGSNAICEPSTMNTIRRLA